MLDKKMRPYGYERDCVTGIWKKMRCEMGKTCERKICDHVYEEHSDIFCMSAKRVA